MEHGKEGGHFYHRDGTTAYVTVGKNGVERPTTLRDARKECLVPGATEIIKMAAKPGLTNWIIDQHIMACLTMPRIEGEPEADYIARIKRDAGAQAEKARERGTQIHAWVQQGFEGVLTDMDGSRYFRSAKKTLDVECSQIEWIPEKTFATDRYGGKVDLHNDQYLIDVKTTDKDLATVKTWEEHSQQLAAYDYGLDWDVPLRHRKSGILYIHVHTAESRLIWIPEDELMKGWKCFNALLDFWYAKTGLKKPLDFEEKEV